MGNGQHYLKSGGFSSYYYVYKKTITAAGLTAKVVAKYNSKDLHEGLPRYSNTSKLYLKFNKRGEIIQLRVYEGRRAAYDFDWGHGHGKEMKEGVVHVHRWEYDSKGTLRERHSPKRYMNNDEIRKYGELIKKANPHAKLRKGKDG